MILTFKYFGSQSKLKNDPGPLPKLIYSEQSTYNLFDHEGVLFFFIKLIKHTCSAKYINYKKICQKLFLKLNTLRFNTEKNATEKWDMYFELMCNSFRLDSCCVPLILLRNMYGMNY